MARLQRERRRKFTLFKGVGGKFRKFSLSLVESFSFNGVILTVIALDALLIGIQASGYVAMKSGTV